MNSRNVVVLFFALLIMGLSACSTNSFINSDQQSNVEPIQAIKELKEGTLVIRVPMQQRKLDTLASIINRKNSSKNSWVSKEYDETEAERQNYFNKVLEELSSNYSFSDYLVIADNQYLKLLDGEKSGVFLNSHGNIDDQITLEGNYLILLLDKVSKQKDFIIVDQEGSVLSRPFPNDEVHNGTYRNRGNVLNKFFRSFSNIGKSDAALNLLDLEYGIKNLDRVLKEFYKNPNRDGAIRK